MSRTTLLILLVLGLGLAGPTWGQTPAADSAPYQALKCPLPTLQSTWQVLERDGANRQVKPYLSSLSQGESAVGVVASPPFVISGDTITFTICGHDGQGGGQGTNYIALVDTRKGMELRKTEAPGNDAMQERQWDVAELKGKEVRVEIHDGNRSGAFAWLGVGGINAAPAMQVDFSTGLPENWSRPEEEAPVQMDVISDGMPFQRNASIYSLIGEKGDLEIPCGFIGKRIFLLGCTVSQGTPMGVYGGVELHYQSGAVDIVPLMYGFTLDGQDKSLTQAASITLHTSGNPFQYYLPVALRDEQLDMIRLVGNPARSPIPKVTAITVETAAQSDRLSPLPAPQLTAAEKSWIDSHTLAAESLDMNKVQAAVRTAYRLPAPPATKVRFKKIVIDPAFRSEGVAVADFNGDGKLDIATGNQYYAGPDWKMQPMIDQGKVFPWKGYSDSFLCFEDDLNGDTAIDLIVVGFPGQTTYWLENPGKSGGSWKKHLAVEQTGNESPEYLDLDGDGRRELLFVSGSQCAVAHPGDDPTQKWQIVPIAAPNEPGAGHGIGAGDMNGDKRLDVVTPDGWWENPGSLKQTPWKFHPAPIFGGVQMCVWDFDGDGDNDVLGASPHAYGIAWTEQTADGWKPHNIDDVDSQTHAVHLADINRDGLVDFVTGKRFWAHNGHDPGSYEPVVLCWYEASRANGQPAWIKHMIDVGSGVGLHFRIVDINGDGRLDIVASNKKGVYLFEQQ